MVVQLTAPPRSLVQRMEALQKGNDIRSKRAALKKRIKQAGKPTGQHQVTELLIAPIPELETMKVWDLLMASRGFGRVKTNKVLSSVRISPSKTIGGLTQRQRLELVHHLRGDRS